MNFASPSVWVSLQDELEAEEVRAEDIVSNLPVAPSSDLPPIEESPDEMLASGLVQPLEEAKAAVPPESSEGFAVPSCPPKPQIANSEPVRRRLAGQVYRQQVDSNVVDIPLSVLREETAVATGDPQFCSNCRALLSVVSAITEREEGVYAWLCEFCGSGNELRLEGAEIPKTNKLTYILESAAEVATAQRAAEGQTTVIFVVDTSGSMCVTQPAPGKFALKTSHLVEEFQGLLGYDEGDQYFEGWDRNTTYISRLQCVQAAIEAQILDFAVSSPERHVGLITFSSEVKVVGDGTHEIVIAGDKLSSQEACLSEVREKFPHFLGKPIRETKEVLLQKVAEMQESGPTALGPAALIAIALAREGGAGAKVILCTDGIANVGLGSLEEAAGTGLEFYAKLADVAKEGSVSVSVLSIEGEECKLNALLPLAVDTGGDVNKVNPLKLREDFANVLASKTVATGVEITVSLHKALQFRNADPLALEQGDSRLVRKLGTVCESESFIFEYCRKPLKSLQDEGVNVAELRKLPFQVLIRYRRSDGMLCVFADTQVMDVTADREFAMQRARYDILSRNAQQVSSNLAMKGRYAQSTLNTVAWGQAMARNQFDPEQVASTVSYYHSSAPLYDELREEMAMRPQAEEGERAANQSDVVALAAHRQQKGSRR